MEEIKLPPPERAAKTAIGAGSSGKGTVGSYLRADALFSEKGGRKLDYGSGRGEGAKLIKADTYEPYVKSKPKYDDVKKIPNASYNKVTSLNVLNVLPPEARNEAVKNIGRILTVNGEAIVSTRGVKDVESAKNKVKAKDGYIIGKGDDARFQKGFTTQELKNYVQKTLGKGFTVETVKGVGKAAIRIKKLNIPKGLGGVLRQEGTPVINIQEQLLYKPSQKLSKGGDIVDKDVEKAAKPKMRPSNQMEMFTYLKDNPDVKGYKEILMDRMRGIITDDDPRAPINTEGTNNEAVRERVLKHEQLLRDIDKYRESKTKVAKGGSMTKQMELFNEGGLKEEGGTVDPVSGNDVPPGSTQEEVRDDIPAQLSEGEFVFPADVVRFIGLEKLMMMRQEAKAGLKRMEDMGQMGNADEATMPDDMPFDINDIDTEDEREYNKGGVVEAATGTFVNQGTGVTSVPSQFAGMNLPSSGTNTVPTYTVPTIPTNVSGYTPKFTAQTGQTNQNVAPTFQTLIGKTPGQYDEMRTYVNDAGQTMQIPFKNGEPIYPIPEGYKFQDPEAIKTDDPTTTAPVTKTTRVVETQQDDGGDDPDDKSVGGATMDVGGRTFSIGYNFDGSITLTDPKTGESKNYDKDNQITKDAKNVTFGQIVDLAKMTPSGIAASIIESAADKLNLKVPGSTKVEKIKIDAKTSKSRLDNTFSGIGDDPSTGMSIENMETIQKGLESGVDTSTKTDISDKAMQDRANKQAAEQRAIAQAKAANAARIAEIEAIAGSRATQPDTSGMDSSFGGGSDDGGYTEGQDFDSDTGFGSDISTAVGGLIPKKKKKTKKMKRGGLASR